MFAESLSTSLRQDKTPAAITPVLSVFNMILLLLNIDETSLLHV